MFEDAPVQQYVYNVKYLRVIDGDTIDVMIDMGLHAYRHERLRLYGINCPEKHTNKKQDFSMQVDAGVKAFLFTVNWLQNAEKLNCFEEYGIKIRTLKDPDAFGRYLAIVWDSAGNCLNADLLKTNNAVEYKK